MRLVYREGKIGQSGRGWQHRDSDLSAEQQRVRYTGLYGLAELSGILAAALS